MSKQVIRHADSDIVRGSGDQKRGNMKLQELMKEARLRAVDPKRLPNVFHLHTRPDDFHRQPEVFRDIGKRIELKSPVTLPDITVISTSKDLMLKLLRFDETSQYSLAFAIWADMHNGMSIQPVEIEMDDGRIVLATRVAGEEGVIIHLS